MTENGGGHALQCHLALSRNRPEHVKRQGVPPTRSELANAMGLKHVSGVDGYLSRMAAKGWLVIHAGVERGLVLTREGAPILHPDELYDVTDAGWLDGSRVESPRARAMTHQGAPTAVGDGGERHAHVPLVDIVAVEGLPIPGQHLFVLVVERVEGRLEKPHETGDAPDILGRAAPLAGDERRIVDVRRSVADVLDQDRACERNGLLT